MTGTNEDLPPAFRDERRPDPRQQLPIEIADEFEPLPATPHHSEETPKGSGTVAATELIARGPRRERRHHLKVKEAHARLRSTFSISAGHAAATR